MAKYNIDRIIRAVKRQYPYFSSLALFNVPILEDESIDTAAVCGETLEDGSIEVKKIIFNPDFLDSLTFEEQVFVFAHEICHIAFKHFIRSIDKPVKDAKRKYEEYCMKESNEDLREAKKIYYQIRYNNIWNIATDACINAFLQRDGLKMPKDIIDKKTGKKMNFVDISDGLYRNAEKIYDDLVKKEEEKEREKEREKESEKNNNSENNNDNTKSSNSVGGGLDDIDIDNYKGIDSHDNWTEKQNQNQNNSESNKKSSGNISDVIAKKTEQEEENNEIDENSMFEKNRQKKDDMFKDALDKSLKKINKELSFKVNKDARPVVSWKSLLIRNLEEEEENWGYRRANRFAPNARIEDTMQDIKSETEVVIDTSGSVSTSLIKEFLMQLVPLFKESKIKVGFFCGSFHGFTEINSVEDIDNLKVIRDGGGTNYEAAATAFSPDNGTYKINKLVFTDGQLDPYITHVQRTSVPGIIWLVFGDKMDFNPISGKIIKVDENGQNFANLYNNDSEINDTYLKIR